MPRCLYFLLKSTRYAALGGSSAFCTRLHFFLCGILFSLTHLLFFLVPPSLSEGFSFSEETSGHTGGSCHKHASAPQMRMSRTLTVVGGAVAAFMVAADQVDIVWKQPLVHQQQYESLQAPAAPVDKVPCRLVITRLMRHINIGAGIPFS